MKMKYLKIVAPIVITILLFIALDFPLIAGGIEPGLANLLSSADTGSRIPVIVKMKENARIAPFRYFNRRSKRAAILKALKEKAKNSQVSIRQLIKNRKGASNIKKLWIINGLALNASPDLINKIALLPSVESVRLDAPIELPVAIPSYFGEPEWNLDAVNVRQVWTQGHRGQGAVIASLDTGVDWHHPDLQDKWRGGNNSWYDFSDPDFNPNDPLNLPFDIDGHGTGVMGIMVGGTLGGTAIGMAPEAQWIAGRIFNDLGESSVSVIHEGFQWILDPDGDPETDDAPDVVNNSWGFPDIAGTCFAEFQNDINALRSADIAVVFSGGNEGPEQMTSVSPADNPGSFSAGAVDEFLLVDSFSSRGPNACDDNIFPDLTAPGIYVKTCGLTYDGILPGSYVYQIGTSFAAPHIAGAMALLRGAYPDMTVGELETVLRVSAVDMGISGPDDDFGYGILDVAGAINYFNDAVTLTEAFYNQEKNRVIIKATTETLPVGSATLTAYLLFDDGSEKSADMAYFGRGDLYRKIFFNIPPTPQPLSVTVTSSEGGSDNKVMPFPVPDNISITEAKYLESKNRIIIKALSDIVPAGSAELKVKVDFADGSSRTKVMAYFGKGDFYRKIFFNIPPTPQPLSVTVTSSAGGSEIVLVQ